MGSRRPLRLSGRAKAVGRPRGAEEIATSKPQGLELDVESLNTAEKLCFELETVMKS